MFKIKNVTVVNNWSDFYANVSDEMLQDEPNIKIHVAGSDEILIMYVFDDEYVIDVTDTDSYLTINTFAYDTFDGLVDAIEDAYSELLA